MTMTSNSSGALMAGATVLVQFVAVDHTSRDVTPILTAAAGALLFGIPADEIAARMTAGMASGTEPFPPEWLRAGERRATEARAATGDTAILAGLAYWAKRDLGIEPAYEVIR